MTAEMVGRHYIDREQLNPRGRLSLRNGVLDIETLEITPSTPEDYFTYQLPVTYDPGADCPRFRQFLREVLDSEEKRDLIQEIMGYCLMYGNPYEKAFMFYGRGGNGKTTLLETFRSLLGRENTSSIHLQSLNEDRFVAADLEGKLANICSENPSRALRDSEMLKRLVSGEGITVQRKFQQPFTMTFGGKLIFATNTLPRTADDTPAFWRRWILIEFTRSFIGREDRQLREKLSLELSGILNFAIEGLRRLRDRGDFAVSGTLADAAEKWRRQSDSLYWFVSERIRERVGAVITKADLYGEYARFCEENGVQAVTKNEVGHRLPQLLPAVRTKRVRIEGQIQACWLNVEVIHPDETVQEASGDHQETTAAAAAGSAGRVQDTASRDGDPAEKVWVEIRDPIRNEFRGADGATYGPFPKVGIRVKLPRRDAIRFQKTGHVKIL